MNVNLHFFFTNNILFGLSLTAFPSQMTAKGHNITQTISSNIELKLEAKRSGEFGLN